LAWAPRSSTCDAQQAAPRATAWAPRLSIGLGTTIKYLRRTAIGAAGNGLGTTIKYLVNQNAGAGSNLAEFHHTIAGREFG
jgi:hypothetical protein